MENEKNARTVPAELPTGTITFLFSDIEGSTKLLEQLKDQYAEMLADHRVILRAAYERWGGHEVDTQGDSFFVAFPSAMDAVNAAAQIQRNLATHKWPSGAEVRVRIGLHTGEARVEGGGYVGMDVHRAARISSIGHGGQILLSRSIANLVERDLPEDLHLQDLDEHRLKDLRRPVRLYQLVIPDLPSTFPPLRSLNALPNNLPTQLTSFIGRQDEIEKIKRLLDERRLVTLLGPGGAGKTRLSMQVAADLVEDYPHGVWLVELAPVTSTENLVPSVASALQFSIDTYSSTLDPKSQLLDYLGNRSMLLVMDNFEHLVQGADLLTEMLAKAPQVKLMVTSRERLNLREEWIYDLAGMSFPTNGDGRGIEAYSALRLFEERAMQTEADFRLTHKEIPHVAQICRQVEGMPLGIELAAGWVSVLSCEEIAEEIKKNLDFLETSMRGVPEAHSSLRAVFNHSWGLLTESQKEGFRKLSIFKGGFTREAASEVAEVDLRLLTRLANKSLLRRTEEGRFEIHELLQQFTEEKLAAENQEREVVQERHSRFFNQFLEKRVRIVSKPGMKHVMDEVLEEHNNLRVAVNWAALHWEESEVRKFFHSLSYYFRMRGWHEGAEAFSHILQYLESHGIGTHPDSRRRSRYLSALIHQCFFSSQLGDTSNEQIILEILPEIEKLDLDPENAVCLFIQGVYAGYSGMYADGARYLEKAAQLLDKSQDDYVIISAITWLGWVYYEMGDYDRAGELYQEAYQISKDRQHLLGIAYTTSKLGTWADARHDYALAKGYHQEAQAVFSEYGDPAGQGYALSRMSMSAWGMGEYEEALHFAKAGLDQFDSVNHRWGVATSICRMGYAELGLGNLKNSREYLCEGLIRSKEFGIVSTMIYALVGFGHLWAVEGKAVQAVEVFTLAMNHPVTSGLYKDFAQRELEQLQEQMTEERFRAAQERGKASALETIVEKILNE